MNKSNYKAVASYIPYEIREWYCSSSDSEVHKVTKHKGIIVCIDASGFTALTKRLANQGKEGPEILTKILNRFFESISNVVFQFEGDVLKFAGDALWAFFADDLNLESFFGSILIALDEVNSSEFLRDTTKLEVHLGAESGFFYLTSLGDPEHRLEAELMGEMLDVVYSACDIAKSNQFVIGSALANQLDNKEKLDVVNDNFYFVKSGAIPKCSDGGSTIVKGCSDIPENQYLERYIPLDVLNRINTSETSLTSQSEYRQVTVLFANFEYECAVDSVDLESYINALNRVLKNGFGIIRKLNGSVARIDPFKSGHKLLVLFGAPVKQENDELNALLCAIQLLALSNSKFRIRIGLAAGPLFCGDVGATNRHEYTVMGDSVNLAARLMSKATWDEILIDAILRDSLPAEVLTESTTFALKGIGNEVTCHRFVNISENTNKDKVTDEIVGQKLPLERLTKVWNKTKAGSRQLVVLTGDAGVGKSTILQSFLQTNDPANCVRIECKNSILFGRGWLIRNLLQQLFVINPRAGTKNIIEFAGKTIDNKWLPLIQEMLQKNSVDNVWTKGLTYELRLDKTRELFVQLVKTLVTSPQSIVIDDFDRADEYSRSLIFSLKETQDNIPLMLIAVAREEQVSLFVSDNSTHFTEITVKVPSNDEWWRFYSEQFENGKREKEFFTRILTVSKGNPQFITGFISYCTSNGQLVQNEISGKWEMFSSEIQISVPENLANLQLAIFDSLPEVQRYVLKCAAVAVADFSSESISNMASELDFSTIHSILKDMVKQDFLYCNSLNSKFSFVNPSMRDAIYECLPESQLRDLHYKYGTILEQSDVLPQYDQLAFHFYRAMLREKGFSYSLMAAQEFYKVHSLTECSVFFKQCLELLKDITEIDIDIQQKLDFYRSYSEFLVLEGKYSDAYKMYNIWRHLGKAEGLDYECLRAAIETARLLWQQTKYSRSRFFLDRVFACKNAFEDREVAAKAYSVMAELERRVGEFRKAQKWSSKSVEIAVESNDYQGISDGYNNLGLALWGEGKLAEAAECYQKSLELSKNHSGMYGQAKISNNLAIIQWELGWFISAENLMAKAIQIFGDIGDRRNEAYASGNIAGLYRITGKLVKAEELFLRADLIFKRLDDLHAHHYTIGNLGDIDIIRGDLKLAESRYTEALKFAQSVGDKELEAECNVRFGELAFFRNMVTEAETKYEQAIKMAEGIGSVEFAIRGKIGLARLCIGQKNYEKALVLIDTILEQARENKAVISENEAVFLKGEFYRISNQVEKALASYNQVLEYAQHQHVFELTLKSAIRLYELDTSARESSSEVLLQLAKQFCEENGPKAWNQLFDSAYFSYFSTTMREMLSNKQMVPSDRL